MASYSRGTLAGSCVGETGLFLWKNLVLWLSAPSSEPAAPEGDGSAELPKVLKRWGQRDSHPLILSPAREISPRSPVTWDFHGALPWGSASTTRRARYRVVFKKL